MKVWSRVQGFAARSVAFVVLPTLFLAIFSIVAASDLTLKDGTVLRGAVQTPVVLRGDKEASIGYILVDDGLRRTIFYKSQLQHFDESSPLTTVKPFRIFQPLNARNPDLVIGPLVSIKKITPFDDFGRRTFTAKDARGENDIPQGITEINPEYIKVQSLKHMWESSIATSSVSPAVLESILRKSINPKVVDDRLRLVRFFIAVEWFVQASDELQAIERDFPAMQKDVQEAAARLEEQKARRRLKEIKMRRTAGQHSFAFQFLREFNIQGAPGDVVVDVRDLTKEYNAIIERMELVKAQIGRLRGEIKNAELQGKLTAPLDEISNALHVESVGRLDNFLTHIANADMPAEEKLAAAISGWLAGNAFAEPNVDRAMMLWDARTKIAQYLVEPNDARREKLMAELKAREAISVDLAAHVIENMAPLVPTEKFEVEKPIEFKIPVGNRTIDYSVLLPYEYNPFRQYPVILTLHGRGVSLDTQISWWSSPPGFQASRQGYIVVAPEYLDDPNQDFEFDSLAHDAVLHTLIDVRRRFSVDSDRVFLSGHSNGGDAAWDIGLAHPDLFAGVIPVCGSPQKYAEFYWQNGENTSFYIIEGEKDGTSPEQNTKVMRRMMEKYFDVIYVEFKGRGHENFSDEILRLFDWMGRRTRKKFPLNFACRAARRTDNEFYFVSVGDFVPGVILEPEVFDRKKLKLAQIEGKINGIANSVSLSIAGPKQADVWISPGMVDLTQPINVSVNGQKASRKSLKMDLEVLLEDFRARADRQKLFYGKVSFPRL